MIPNDQFDIFLAAIPGLEADLCSEVRERQFGKARIVPGGVVIRGGWREVWRANLQLRGAARVLAQVARFRVEHLNQLGNLARGVAWRTLLRPGSIAHVEAATSRSRIYHSAAAAERVAKAIVAVLGEPAIDGVLVTVKVRIEADVATLAIDTSGEPLHRRGHKQAVAKAPLRETMAAPFLRQCGFKGDEPVLDPMCGAGTFVIEAAEMAANLQPGRSRAFAFEALATFDPAEWQRLKGLRPAATPDVRFHGRDRDAGAVRMSRENAERAGVAAFTSFEQGEIADLVPPPGPPGLVMLNPPYGGRIGDKRDLVPLYRQIGSVLAGRFPGWRVGLVTSEPTLAAATGLPFLPTGAPVLHGGMRIALYRTGVLVGD